MAVQEDFQRELDRIFKREVAAGSPCVDVLAGALHAAADDGAGNRVPNCCRVMRKNMRFGDSVVYSPPGGDGTKFCIRFLLPR